MHKSSAGGWRDVDHDRLIHLVAVEVGIIPALALADLVKPEGCVRAVRPGDVPDRARLIEIAHEAGEPDAEAETLDDQRALCSLADDRDVIDDGGIDGDEVLKVKGTVRALPACQVREEGGRARGTACRTGLGEHPLAADDPAPENFLQPDGEAIWRRNSKQPVVPAEQLSGRVVHMDRQHAATLSPLMHPSTQILLRLPGRSSAYGYCSICPEQSLERGLGQHA